MIAAARRLPEVSQGVPAGRAPGSAPTAQLRFSELDARAWHPTAPVDVIVSNALLQWLPGHEELLIKWLGYLAEGGWLAFQVPANHDQVAHTLLHEQAGDRRSGGPGSVTCCSAWTTGDPASYLELLASEGCTVDAWETTYMQLLSGENPVLEWFKGTALRPVLAALDEEARENFSLNMVLNCSARTRLPVMAPYSGSGGFSWLPTSSPLVVRTSWARRAAGGWTPARA